MMADFLDAHQRHWDDAELLFNATCWANADHLYGLSAECGLKRLMERFGMVVDMSTGTPKNHADRVHIMEHRRQENAWDRYESYRHGKNAVAYALPAQNPFQDWDISQRYAHRTNFTQEIAEAHRDGAKSVHHLITIAVLEGILS
ncbi:SAM-dependent methyltransferase [Ectothiorhodospiraceae bacterium BW-2]|nr:SAM-dependent methyltransferase [Ectothiorhodospiraceae bacterium BW-2]